MAPRKVIVFQKDSGREPLTDWLNDLKDLQAAQRIRMRLFAVAKGNLGDHKSVGGGVFELRFPIGPGYRVYFGQRGAVLVVLLCAGSKRSQQRDIETARRYWATWLELNQRSEK
jgi:putative addiction module killer protein